MVRSSTQPSDVIFQHQYSSNQEGGENRSCWKNALWYAFPLNQNVFANLKLNTIEVLREDFFGWLCKIWKSDLQPDGVRV